MAAIHVIRKDDPTLPRIEIVDRATETYRSGYWVLSGEKARALIGGKIFFHRKQSSPSFFGGVITAEERIGEGEYAGRVLFTFRQDESCRNVRTGPEGWAQEMKLE